MSPQFFTFFFFFNDTATTEIYTLSLHDALPISCSCTCLSTVTCRSCMHSSRRSEKHTSELQSRRDLVCRLLLEKKKERFSKMITLPRASRKYALSATTTDD